MTGIWMRGERQNLDMNRSVAQLGRHGGKNVRVWESTEFDCWGKLLNAGRNVSYE